MDYRLNSKRIKQEEQIHIDLLKIVEKEGAYSVHKELKRLSKPTNLGMLTSVLAHLYILVRDVK